MKNEFTSFIFYIVITIFAVLIFIIVYGEVSRLLFVKKLRSIYAHNAIAKYSYALFGRKASIRNLILSSINEKIFYFRVLLAERFNGIYLAYYWDLKSCFHPDFTYTKSAMLVVSDENLSRKILEDKELWVKPPTRGPTRSISSLACTSQRGQDAQRQRRILISAVKTPASFLPRVRTVVQKLIVDVSTAINGGDNVNGVLDLLPLINKASLDLVMSLIFGDDTCGLREFTSMFLLYWDLVRTNPSNLSTACRERRDCELESKIEEIRGGIFELTQQRQILIQSQTPSEFCIIDSLLEKTVFQTQIEANYNDSNCPPNTHQPMEFRTLCPENSKPSATQKYKEVFSVNELIHNLHNLILASFETTAHTFAVSVFHVSCSSEYQELLSAMSSTFPNTCSDADLRTSNDKNLQFLKAVVKEALRLHPPVLQMARICTNHTSLGLFTCPKGTHVIVDIAGMHRRVSVWGSNAADFEPSRWFLNDKSGSFQKNWIPFGLGAKSCLGQRIALMSVEEWLMAFMQAFKLEKHPKFTPRFVQTPTLRFSYGLEVKIKIRQQASEQLYS